MISFIDFFLAIYFPNVCGTLVWSIMREDRVQGFRNVSPRVVAKGYADQEFSLDNKYMFCKSEISS